MNVSVHEEVNLLKKFTMADLLGNPNFLRPTDSWSWTEVRSVKYTHGWTVKGFTSQSDRYLETSFKPLPSDSTLTFRIRLHPQGNKESNKDFTFFQVFCNTSSIKYRGKFTVYNSRNEEIATTVYMGQQQLHGYFEYTRRDLLINHLAPSDELQILLELNMTFDTVTKSTLSRPPLIESKPNEVARDFEQFFRDSTKKHSDFLIETSGGQEIQTHKVVLIARSQFFAAMLEPHTEESQNSRVKFDDIDVEVMNEVLMYMYSGKSPNLKEMAPDLLPVADRFALTGLKDMAEQVMRTCFSIDNVCRILLLADMHGARDLKQDAMSFLAQNSTAVIQTDGWRQMIISSPSLVTEVVSAISAEQPYNVASALATGIFESSPKRARIMNQDRPVQP